MAKDKADPLKEKFRQLQLLLGGSMSSKKKKKQKKETEKSETLVQRFRSKKPNFVC